MIDFSAAEHAPIKGSAISYFADLRRSNLSDHNLSQTPIPVLQTAQFDTETTWPKQDKLPHHFSPQKLLEDSKNPGLGIRELRRQGITGKGITVAIIDQRLDTNHPEYRDAITDYREYGETGKEGISMHGPAVASLLVGKDCGVAPGARLVYRAVPSGTVYALRARALNDIIKENASLVADNKVRVVSCSIGFAIQRPEPGLNEWIDALKRAQEAGIVVIDTSNYQQTVLFSGGGSIGNKDDVQSYNPWLSIGSGDMVMNDLIAARDIDKMVARLKVTDPGRFINTSESDIRKQLEYSLDLVTQAMTVPSDYRTMASSWGKKNQYMYNGNGGLSWAVPYLAGMYALAFQINPNLTGDQVSEIIKKSAVINSKGLKVINPKGIIDLARQADR